MGIFPKDMGVNYQKKENHHLAILVVTLFWDGELSEPFNWWIVTPNVWGWKRRGLNHLEA